MKLLRKLTTTFVVAALLVSTMITASAIAPTITSDAVITAGQSVDVVLDFDSLLGMREYEFVFTFPTASFDVDSSDNTAYNFGSKIKPAYEKMYVLESLVAARKEEYHATILLTDFKTTTYVDGDNTVIKIYGTDSTGYAIGADMDIPEVAKDFGITIAAAADIAPGVHPVEVSAKIGDVNSSVIYKETKTVNFTVEGEEPDPEPVATAVKTFAKRLYVDNTLYTVGVISEGTNFATETIKAGIRIDKAGVMVPYWTNNNNAPVSDGKGTSYYAVALNGVTAETDIKAESVSKAVITVNGGAEISGDEVSANDTSVE